MNTPEIQSLWRQIDEWSKGAYSQPAQSWEEYQRRLGIYQGLVQAVDLLISLQNEGEDR